MLHASARSMGARVPAEGAHIHTTGLPLVIPVVRGAGTQQAPAARPCPASPTRTPRAPRPHPTCTPPHSHLQRPDALVQPLQLAPCRRLPPRRLPLGRLQLLQPRRQLSHACVLHLGALRPQPVSQSASQSVSQSGRQAGIVTAQASLAGAALRERHSGGGWLMS